MSRQKPLVIYHANCWDGFCAAWVARRALGEIEAVPRHYGQSPPRVAGRQVYVLDFSFPREVMRGMAAEAELIVVLDHHKTAEAALVGLDEELAPVLTVVFDMQKSGGRLAWEYFWDFHLSHGEGGVRYSALVDGSGRGLMRDKAPWLVDYTEDRDLWRHALVDSENINAALRSYPLDFELWDQFHDNVGQRELFKREGAAIRRAERQVIDAHVRNARVESFSLLVGGPSAADDLRVPVVNATTLFSEIAGELAKGQPFAACYFDRRDGMRQWSLRSDENGVDVSEIAKAHGGGGHARAAGFQQATR